MDKRIILAVAGAGKTTHIVENLNNEMRSVIITYTIGNYANLRKKIVREFNDKWPENITLMSYFTFLYSFCYKPFLADKVRARGIIYESNKSRFVNKENANFYLTDSKYFYSNRLAFSFEYFDIIEDIKQRIDSYFDELVIDEIQDISGRDFNFLLKIMEANVNMLFVGDFFQHTFDTSRDGNVNKNLFNDYTNYKAKFLSKGFNVDETTLNLSWRCNQSTCKFIRENLGIEINPHNNIEQFKVNYIENKNDIFDILNNDNIIKLHYNNSSTYGENHKNWGEVKGEDCYKDVCIVLNKTTEKKYKEGKLIKLAPSTKNKLYVALTRARNNTYLISDINCSLLSKHSKK